MKRFLLILAFSLCFSSVAFSDDERKEQSDGVPSLETELLSSAWNGVSQPQRREPRRGALSIHYYLGDSEQVRLLEFGKNDLEATRQFLLARGFAQENIVALTGDAANWRFVSKKANIFATLDQFLANLDEKDEFFLTIAGSGGEAEGRRWFQPFGATSRKDDRWIAIDEIVRKIEESQCGRATILVLTNGLTIYRPRPDDELPQKDDIVVEIDPKTTLSGRTTIVYACQNGETARENKERESDAFLANLLDEAARVDASLGAGDAIVAAFAQAAEKTVREAGEKSEAQHPMMEQR